MSNIKTILQCKRGKTLSYILYSSIHVINSVFVYSLQNGSIGRMLNIMDSYYSNMKEDMGIFQKDNSELLED